MKTDSTLLIFIVLVRHWRIIICVKLPIGHCIPFSIEMSISIQLSSNRKRKPQKILRFRYLDLRWAACKCTILCNEFWPIFRQINFLKQKRYLQRRPWRHIFELNFELHHMRRNFWFICKIRKVERHNKWFVIICITTAYAICIAHKSPSQLWVYGWTNSHRRGQRLTEQMPRFERNTNLKFKFMENNNKIEITVNGWDFKSLVSIMMMKWTGDDDDEVRKS